MKKHYENKDRKRRLLDRDGGNCRWCGINGGWDLQIDHKYPRSMGGGDEDENLVLACGPCNIKKSDQISVEYENKVSQCRR